MLSNLIDYISKLFMLINFSDYFKIISNVNTSFFMSIRHETFIYHKLHILQVLVASHYKLNNFSNYEAAGQFINDVNEIEYISYFNVAQY